MRKVIIVLGLLINIAVYANEEDWGKTGHRATAEIAESYLKRKTTRKIKELLDGKSLALIANYGDDIKSDPMFRKYSQWHYVNIPEGKTYEDVKSGLEENLIGAIQECVAKLKSEKTVVAKKQFYLKMLVHLVGDLHQPMHVGHAADKGGNDISLKWFNDETNLHRVWDSNMINFYGMSYSELAENQKKLSRKEVKAIQKGSVVDWARESQELVESVYASVEEGDRISYRYMYDWFPQVRVQLQKGGIRLAEILNDIYA